jgi:hypothetical protein
MSLLKSSTISQLGFGGQTPPVTNPNPLGAGGKKTLNGSLLSFGGQTPPVTNPNPLGEGGVKTLAGSILDRNNGATPKSYLDNPPK